MGHTSKFTFPLPGRKQKATSPAPPSNALSKAQKVLGTGEANANPSMLAPRSKWGWETKSNSAISISVSDTTAAPTDGGNHHAVGGYERRWEEESDIIPRAFTRQDNMNLAPPIETVADASSLRRRESSSTIASYYDKSKLPLAISQQTSSSAMAKGLPSKAHALLDFDNTVEQPKPGPKKKKPGMLDLSNLLSRSSKHLKPGSHKPHVLGPDMMTTSPSVLSSQSDSTPPPIRQKVDRAPRKKPTRESLREMPSLAEYPPAQRQEHQSSTNAARHRSSSAAVNLNHLYDHYEQRSFADIIEDEQQGVPQSSVEAPVSKSLASPPTTLPPTRSLPMPPRGSDGQLHLFPAPIKSTGIQPKAKQPSVSDHPEMALEDMISPSLMSPLTDNASISSRHTRTSKASKRTDRSITDLDLRQNSVLSLSSDSEDDSYGPSARGSLAVPLGLSDGQASPTSPRSAVSQRSASALSHDGSRGKAPKRTSFASSPQFLPIPEGAATVNPPKVNSRSSSKQQTSITHQTSRTSVSTVSTSKTVLFGIADAIDAQDARAKSAAPVDTASSPELNDAHFDFPAPPIHRSQRPSVTSQASIDSVAPTSIDIYLQSQRSSTTGQDNSSIYSGQSFGKGSRRDSTTSSVRDDSSGRFMAVTRQEEMLLAALRMKRARMREDIIAEFEGDMEREENGLQRRTTNDSTSATSSSRVSRQSSNSTMRTTETTGALSARPQPRPQIRISADATEKRAATEKQQAAAAARGQILLMMDRPVKDEVECETAEPSPDGLSDFFHFDDASHEMFPMPASSSSSHHLSQKETERRGSKTSSTNSGSTSGASRSAVGRPGAWVAPLPAREKPRARATSNSRRDSDQISPKTVVQRAAPEQRILEGPAEEEEDAGIPRPDSPISPSDFPAPVMSMARKRQVRLSAVGNYKPNIESGWWDHSG